MKSMKSYVIGALVITISVIVMGLSASYAWYINTVQEVSEHSANKGLNVTSGSLVMQLATTNDKYINATAAGLVTESDALAGNDYTSFSISLPSTSSVNLSTYKIYLDEIKMTENFVSPYLKWKLLKYNTSTSTWNAIANGDFSTATKTSETQNADGTYNYNIINLLTNQTISKTTSTVTDSYKLYVWLDYSSTVQQNSLLNGKMSMKVGFKATTAQ